MSFPKPLDLTGRVALVTGGSKGLGRAMARGLAEAGADVVISSRHEEELRPALDAILSGTGRRGHYVVADMNDRAAVKRLADEAVRKFGKVDILVNNAGSNAPQPIDVVTDDAWDRHVETLSARAAWLNGLGLDRVVLRANGTELEVGMARRGRWCAADEVTIHGAHASPNAYEPVIDAMEKRLIDVRRLLANSYPLTRFDDAMAAAMSGDVLKTLVTPV